MNHAEQALVTMIVGSYPQPDWLVDRGFHKLEAMVTGAHLVGEELAHANR